MNTVSIAAIVLVAAACVPDLKTRRIPNVLTFGATAAALLFHLATGGWPALGASAGGWILGIAMFFPFFALRGLGAGDVKLLGAVGAWLGPWLVIWVALYTAVAGGVLGIVVAAGHGYLRTAISNIRELFLHWRLFGLKPHALVSLDSAKGPRLAYAVPIAIGTVVTVWLK